MNMTTSKISQDSDQTAPIVCLTPGAINKIKSMMARDNKEEHCLRIGVVAGGCAGMSYDLRLQKTPYENDIQWQQDGITIITNSESVTFLHGTTIDYVDTLKESGFKYQNPNASGSCGCGTSFS